ncbi:MAG: FAD-dependent oxidoreductase [Pseudomonadota bacterium]
MQSDIVIVGGGAGGLELACKLGRKLGPSKVALVDCRLSHIWKPSLHEVAAGTLDINQEGLSYQMLAHDNGYAFVYGPMVALDPATKRLTVGAVNEGTEQLLPARELAYGALVIAVGSTSNYFGVPGAREHTISLNATEDAEHFRLTLLKLLNRAEHKRSAAPSAPDTGAVVNIVIIGGGATGVELAAELREASGVYAAYGLHHLRAERDVRITLLEGAPRILAPLPQRVAAAALKLLARRAIDVVTACRVTAVGADRVSVADGPDYPADLCVWAAGIKAPELLATLGLPTAKGGQVQVDGALRVPGHADIYAMGDCAACVDAKGKVVPPRAQAAHQQAHFLYQALLEKARGKAPSRAQYVYRDYGSLVSLGQSSTVGSLMGSLRGLSWFVEGFFARLMYVSLHLMHHQAVLGTVRTAVLAVARFLIKRSTPLVKLH